MNLNWKQEQKQFHYFFYHPPSKCRRLLQALASLCKSIQVKFIAIYSFVFLGGYPSKRGNWPWQVAILNSWRQPFCGGTIVAPGWVLTAAHCVRKRSYVRLGEHDIQMNDVRFFFIFPNISDCFYTHLHFFYFLLVVVRWIGFSDRK